MIDTYLAFTSPSGVASSCRLLVNGHCVVASDINDGASVTNSVEAIATAAVAEYDLDPRQLVFIEHYPTTPGSTADYDQERCARVTFTWSDGQAHTPAWKHVSKADAEALLRAPIRIEAVVAVRAATRARRDERER